MSDRFSRFMLVLIAVLLCANLVVCLAGRRPVEATGRQCVGVSAVVEPDGDVRVYKAYSDGYVTRDR